MGLVLRIRFFLTMFVALSIPSFSCDAQVLQQSYSPYTDRANKPQPMPLSDRLAVEVVLNRPVLGIEAPDTSAIAGMMGGLTGGIGGVVAAMASGDGADIGSNSPDGKRIARLRAHLGDYDFNHAIEKSIRSKIASPGISPDPMIAALENPLGTTGSPVPAAFATHVLMIYPSYVIDYRYDRVKVVLFVRVMDRRLNSKGRIVADVSFRRTYSSAFLIEDGSDDENVDRWLSLSTEQLRSLFDRASEQAVDMLVHDFSEAGRREWKRHSEKKSARLRGSVFPGLPIRQDENMVWVRSGTRLQWIEGFEFLEIPKAAVR